MKIASVVLFRILMEVFPTWSIGPIYVWPLTNSTYNYEVKGSSAGDYNQCGFHFGGSHPSFAGAPLLLDGGKYPYIDIYIGHMYGLKTFYFALLVNISSSVGCIFHFKSSQSANAITDISLCIVSNSFSMELKTPSGIARLESSLSARDRWTTVQAGRDYVDGQMIFKLKNDYSETSVQEFDALGFKLLGPGTLRIGARHDTTMALSLAVTCITMYDHIPYAGNDVTESECQSPPPVSGLPMNQSAGCPVSGTTPRTTLPHTTSIPTTTENEPHVSLTTNIETTSPETTPRTTLPHTTSIPTTTENEPHVSLTTNIDTTSPETTPHTTLPHTTSIPTTTENEPQVSLTTNIETTSPETTLPHTTPITTTTENEPQVSLTTNIDTTSPETTPRTTLPHTTSIPTTTENEPQVSLTTNIETTSPETTPRTTLPHTTSIPTTTENEPQVSLTTNIETTSPETTPRTTLPHTTSIPTTTENEPQVSLTTNIETTSPETTPRTTLPHTTSIPTTENEPHVSLTTNIETTSPEASDAQITFTPQCTRTELDAPGQQSGSFTRTVKGIRFTDSTNLMATVRVNSKSRCADMCLNDIQCMSFLFKRSALGPSICSIYSTFKSNGIVQQLNSDLYVLKCH